MTNSVNLKFKKEQKIYIPGPAGYLEALASELAHFKAQPMIGIICHPHPLYQGTMHNKVVTTIMRAWQAVGLETIRFNFRGVGGSTGSYDKGVGEVLDLKAVLAFAKKKAPNARFWLAGFSFGALIALKAVALEPQLIAGLVSIAPALAFFEGVKLALPSCPWLVIQGEQDELVPQQEVRTWYQLFIQEKDPAWQWEFILLPGANHFFHGQLITLRQKIEQFMHQVLLQARTQG